MNYILQRGCWYHYKRYIPKLYQHLHDNEFIQISLKTDSRRIAEQRVSALNSEIENMWKSYGLKNEPIPNEEYEAAIRIMKMGGYDMRPLDEVVKENIGAIVPRIRTIEDKMETEKAIVSAVLGDQIKTDVLKLSEALDEFIDFQVPNLINKSEDQIRKWKNPRIRAVKDTIAVCGDKPVNEYTRKDILQLRKWWIDRIDKGEVTASPANKCFGFVAQIFRFIKDDKNIDIHVSMIFARVRLKEEESTRPPFQTAYIRETLLNDGGLQGLNEECRLFLYAMADTGARPSELVGLDAQNGDIQLDKEIPFINIRPSEKKGLKTAQSKRQIPLVGASLYAFQQLPQGFLHYYRRADALSATLNKYLRENNLLPTSEHVVYSLRHSFEDRLTAVELPEKVQAALMGHKYSRERYGDGPSLEQKQEWLNKICFDMSSFPEKII